MCGRRGAVSSPRSRPRNTSMRLGADEILKMGETLSAFGEGSRRVGRLPVGMGETPSGVGEKGRALGGISR
jgi:hypothetical protein